VRALLFLAGLAAAGCGSRSEAASAKDDGKPRTPEAALSAVAAPDLCITKGSPDATVGTVVGDPTFRAVAPHTSGEAASLTFTYGGATEEASALASGKVRRQLGLKLRAENGCNLVYVMWRLDPSPKLEVSVKLNPGAKDHEDCGADGYSKVKPTRSSTVPHLSPRTQHTLRAELRGSELVAWIDGTLAWRGVLPAKAGALRGPAGVRSDNLVYSLDAFEATASQAAPSAEAKCVGATDG
jgi:hypothetical protein